MTEKVEKAKQEEPAATTIIGKLVMASRLVKAVAKDGNNQRQGYSFQSEAAIKEAVKSAINTVGIQIIPNYEVINQYERQTNKGGTMHFVDVMGHFEITDGVDHVGGSMPGSGQDSGEKAMMKATTASQKYFYKQLFNISDRDTDPDGDDSQPAGGFRSDQQQQTQYRPAPQQQPPAQQAPQLASQMDVKVFKQMAFDFAQSQGVNVQTVFASAFMGAHVPKKSFNQVTSEELGLLKRSLANLMG